MLTSERGANFGRYSADFRNGADLAEIVLIFKSFLNNFLLENVSDHG